MGLSNLWPWRREKKKLREAEPLGQIVVDSDMVTYVGPDGKAASIPWPELQSVGIRTTNEGPFAEDVFFVLTGTQAQLIVPQGASGAQALFTRLGSLPGFNYDAAIKAMTCTDNQEFACWSVAQ